MKAERLFRVLGLTDPALVEEALEAGRRPWKRWAAMAACLALAAGLGFGWLAAGGFGGYGSSMSGSSGSDCLTGNPSDSGAGGSGVEDGTAFLSYAGPVLPLTALENPEGLTAEREITWDFTPGAYPDGEPRQWGVQVTDAYRLSNSTDADIAVTALYPFAGTFDSLAETRPAVTVDGERAEAALYAGPYSGGFRSAGEEDTDTLNLESLRSWTGYRDLLEDGTYREQTLGESPVLDVPVTVYAFSDFSAPHEQYQAATQAISFAIDPERTQVLTYGINGMEAEGDFRRYSYFVPDGVRHEPEVKLLAVLGEDIGEYALQGYQNGGCEEGEEINGVSCTVTRWETTLDAVLDRLCRYSMEWYGKDRGDTFAAIPYALYRRAAAELFSQYGPLSQAAADRYADGRLDDILQETLHQQRVLYLTFPVTVPAGESVRVECASWKEPSFDYACSGSENEGLQGYDLMTRLGSNLPFTAQRAVLAGAEGVELTGQSFGFDPAGGVYAVELDLGQERYYLEVRPREP